VPGAGRLGHEVAGDGDERERFAIADRPRGAPWIHGGGKACLGFPEVADSRDRALIQQRVADRPRGIVVSQPSQEPLPVELVAEDVGAKLGQTWV
jgi:hypothetical protein